LAEIYFSVGQVLLILWELNFGDDINYFIKICLGLSFFYFHKWENVLAEINFAVCKITYFFQTKNHQKYFSFEYCIVFS